MVLLHSMCAYLKDLFGVGGDLCDAVNQQHTELFMRCTAPHGKNF